MIEQNDVGAGTCSPECFPVLVVDAAIALVIPDDVENRNRPVAEGVQYSETVGDVTGEHEEVGVRAQLDHPFFRKAPLNELKMKVAGHLHTQLWRGVGDGLCGSYGTAGHSLFLWVGGGPENRFGLWVNHSWQMIRNVGGWVTTASK